MDFSTFLENKPLYYKEINHERVYDAYALLKPHIKQPKTVHIVGTNGKGSTGRMIAHLAYEYSGTPYLSIGHYTSPHIMRFNERIWLNGQDVSDEVLELAHQRLFAILGREMSESLSYFEYTTLLAFVVFENCDLMVLEAGLGGEFDATNVCDKELSIITPIGIDHQAFLGESIEEIARTKIRSIQKKVLLAPQVYDEVMEIAQEIAREKGALLTRSHTWRGNAYENRSENDSFSADKSEVCIPTFNVGTRVSAIAKEKAWPDYLTDNAMVALQALDILNIKYDVNDLISLKLFGRFYALTPNIRIDVGHNPLAAQVIEKALDKKVVLIYNSLDDKDYEEVLRILKPKVKRVEILPIHAQRATTLEEIENALEKVGLAYSFFEGKVDKYEDYLVFGSFYVVEAFLKKMNL